MRRSITVIRIAQVYPNFYNASICLFYCVHISQYKIVMPMLTYSYNACNITIHNSSIRSPSYGNRIHTLHYSIL